MSQTSINTYQDCDHFGFPATIDDDGELVCTHCNQRIEIVSVIEDQDIICPGCGGTGRRNGGWCPYCGGKGDLW